VRSFAYAVLGAPQLNATEWIAATPVPLSAINVGEVVALLVTVTLPLICSAFFGANVTFNVADCVGAMVVPFRPPPALASIPVTEIPDTVTLEFPVFVRFTGSVRALPTFSVPKFRFTGAVEIVRVAGIPVPLSLITTGGADPAVVIVTEPFAALPPVGVYRSVKPGCLPRA
jgi:hypothetical protein